MRKLFLSPFILCACCALLLAGCDKEDDDATRATRLIDRYGRFDAAAMAAIPWTSGVWEETYSDSYYMSGDKECYLSSEDALGLSRRYYIFLADGTGRVVAPHQLSGVGEYYCSEFRWRFDAQTRMLETQESACAPQQTRLAALADGLIVVEGLFCDQTSIFARNVLEHRADEALRAELLEKYPVNY